MTLILLINNIIVGLFLIKSIYLVIIDLNLNTDSTRMTQFQEKQYKGN